jgi:hypothetical protein
MNPYNVYFVSKATGPRTVQIEAHNESRDKVRLSGAMQSMENDDGWIAIAYNHEITVSPIFIDEERADG